MLVYLGSYFILFLLTLRELIVKEYSKRDKVIFFLSILILYSLISGFRNGIGEDFYTYESIFQGVQNFTDFSYLEPGFRLVIVLLKRLGFTSNSLFFVFSLISYSFLIVGLKKYNFRPVLSFFIYFLVFNIGYSYNGIRQGIAMSIFIFLLEDFKNDKGVKIFFFSIIATSFHVSGILIYIAYIFQKFPIKRNSYILLTTVLSIFYFLSPYLSSHISTVVPSFLASKLLNYNSVFGDSVDIIGFIQRLLIVCVFLFYYDNIKKHTKLSFEKYFQLYYLGFIIYVVFASQGMFATRINMLFRVLEIILFPMLMEINIKKTEKFFLFFIIILWTTLIFYTELNNPANFPYKSIFN